MDELKPCPFCGSTNLLKRSDPHGPNSTERDYYIFCGCCGTQGPWFKSKGLAVQFWNTRAEVA